MRWKATGSALVLFLLWNANLPDSGQGAVYRDSRQSPRVVTIKDFYPAKPKPKISKASQAIPRKGDSAPARFKIEGMYVSPIAPQLMYVHLNAFRSEQGLYCVMNIYMLVKQGAVLSREIDVQCTPESWEAGKPGQAAACVVPDVEAPPIVLPASWMTSSPPPAADPSMTATSP